MRKSIHPRILSSSTISSKTKKTIHIISPLSIKSDVIILRLQSNPPEKQKIIEDIEIASLESKYPKIELNPIRPILRLNKVSNSQNCSKILDQLNYKSIPKINKRLGKKR